MEYKRLLKEIDVLTELHSELSPIVTNYGLDHYNDDIHKSLDKALLLARLRYSAIKSELEEMEKK